MIHPDIEMVDVVDENCRVLDVVSKPDAHVRGLLHKTVIGMVEDSQGRWMLVRQSPHRQDAGQYVSPVGGHVSAGESDEAAIRREAEEEIGYADGYELTYIGRAIYERHVLGRHENHYFILFKITSDAVPTLSHEAESYHYFTMDELREELRLHPKNFGDAFYFVLRSFFPDF